MSHSAIYDAVRRRTKKAFGFAVNLHRFRHAAGCFWSIQDPVNVRGVKDLMGHASFEKTTEKHYVMGQSRLAGRALARPSTPSGPRANYRDSVESPKKNHSACPSSRIVVEVLLSGEGRRRGAGHNSIKGRVF
jgi:hypothetical protein